MADSTPTTSRRALLGAIPVSALFLGLPASAASDIHGSFRAGQQARAGIATLPHNATMAQEAPFWSAVDACEAAIHADRSPASIEYKLWIALSHSLTDAKDDAAITAADFAHFDRHDAGFDWTDRLIISAIRALRSAHMAGAL